MTETEIDPHQLLALEGYKGRAQNAFVLRASHTQQGQILDLWRKIRKLPPVNPFGNRRLTLGMLIVQGLRLLHNEMKQHGSGKH